MLVAAILISAFAFTLMQGRSQLSSEPQSLADIVNYPGEYEMHDLPPEAVETEMIELELTGLLAGMPLEGYHDLKGKLMSKGYDFPAESFFDVYMSDVYLWTPEGDMYYGRTLKWWSEEGPNGTKAMLTGAVMMDTLTMELSSIIFAATTNVLPPEEMPGIDPFIIWNAEPYFYIQFWWWHPYYLWTPPYRITYWKYWWYDSHKSPNWFWGPYWWWRTYIKARWIDIYPVSWYPWWWWWWHWYYFRGWYWWSTYWLY